ncbi:MAG: STAS domain-containing protein [Kineosporiaceae bacterium]
MDESFDTRRIGLDRLSLGHPRHDLLSTYRRDGCHVVVLRGDLDLYTGPAVRRIVGEIAQSDPQAQVVVDMTELSFLDSSGLGVLIGGLRRLRAGGGSMHLAGCRGPVRDVLTITGLHQAFPIHENLHQALAAVAGSAGTDAP